MNPVIHVDAWFDVICPWCLIGKRHLESAIARWQAQHPAQAITVRWHGVQLLKDLPAPGVPYEPFYVQRLGSRAAVRGRQQQVLAAALAADVHIDFARIAVMPNTARAHQLLAAVARDHRGRHEALLDAFYQAHFVDGRHLGDRDTLLAIAAEQGIPADWLARWRERPRLAVHVDDSLAAANGVPAFLINQRHSVVSAQSPEVFLNLFRRLHAEALAAHGVPA